MWLPEVVAHEAHHSVRIRRGPGYGSTLGGAMVTEGLATVFAREVFPATPPQPWAHALSGEQRVGLWAIAHQLLDTPPGPSRLRFFREWFLGAGRIPRGAGYTLGAELVTAYLASHPGATAASLVREPSASIIANSPYDPGPPDPNRPRCFTDAAQSQEVLCDQYKTILAANTIRPEPRKCYVISSAITVAEATCVTAADDGR